MAIDRVAGIGGMMADGVSVNLSGSNVTADINVGTLSNMVYKATPTFKWKFVANTPSGLGSNEFDQTAHTIYVTYADPIADGGSLTDRRLNLVCTRASGQTNILGVADLLYPLTGANGCANTGSIALNFAGLDCATQHGADITDTLTDNWYMYSPAEEGVWDVRGACIAFAELHNLELQVLGISAGTPAEIVPIPDVSFCSGIVQCDLDHPEYVVNDFPCPCTNTTLLAFMQYCAGSVPNNFEGVLQVVDGTAIMYYAGGGAVHYREPKPSAILGDIFRDYSGFEYWRWEDNLPSNGGILEPACCSSYYCVDMQGPSSGGTMSVPDCP